MVRVVELTDVKSLKEFIKFPFKLYENNPYWIPPIIKEELKTLDKNQNSAFKNANVFFLLAKRKGKTVGRAAAIVNQIEVEEQKVRKIRFGWIDFIDDYEVSKALFDKIANLGKAHQLDFMEGPLGFSNMDKAGVLTKGFDSQGSMEAWYNHPYYKSHFENEGFKVEKEYVEKEIYYNKIHNKLFLKFERLAKGLSQKYELKALNFKKKEEVIPYVDKLFELMAHTYNKLPSYVPLTQLQIDYYKTTYFKFLNPEYVKIIIDNKGEMVAFSVVLPSYANALKKANGKLNPFGLFHLLRAKRVNKQVSFYLIGIHPAYQNKGVNAILFNEYIKIFNKKKIERCFITPQLTTNIQIKNILSQFNPVITKERCTYKKEL